MEERNEEADVKASRLNHSCTPNVFHRFSTRRNQFTIHALRPIMAGEELLTSYIDIIAPSSVRRKAFLNWGFECGCALCRLGSHDVQRTALEIKVKGLRDQGYPDVKTGHDLGVPDEVIALMSSIGLNESDTTGDAYEAAAHSRLELGYVDQALDMAVRAREVHRVCLGEDSLEFERVTALLEDIESR